MKTAEDFLVQHAGVLIRQVATLQANLSNVAESVNEASAQSETTLATLYECVASGQVDEAGTAKLMQDPLFAAYYAKKTA